MLGFGVVSDKPFPDNVSLVPTDLNFMVSAYKNDLGKSTQDFPAYTLNYLIMSNDKAMSQPVPFAWNWIEKDNLSNFAGSVAINRNTFADFLNKLISPSLKKITQKPKVTVKVNLIEGKISQSFTPATGTFKYKSAQTAGCHILTYEYCNINKDSDTFVPNWANYSVTHTAKSDIYLKGTEIKNVTEVKAHCHLNVEGGVQEGDWAHYSLTTRYKMAVNAQGRISVKMSQEPIHDKSQEPDLNLWSTIVSAGTIKNCVEELSCQLKSFLKNFVKDESTKIENMLNGSNTWVFPGSKTFTFKDVEFSAYQDLIAHVLYTDPNS